MILKSKADSMADIEKYHKKQFENIFRSTIKFVDWLEQLGHLSHDKEQCVCDIGCGAGSNCGYLGDRFTKSQFIGIDLSQQLIEYGNEMLRERKNCKLYQGDWFQMDMDWKDKFNGVISFQTLSWLSDYHQALLQLAKLNPKWIAISSLFYEGDIDYNIKLKNYYHPSRNEEYKEMYYNIYSLIQIRRYFENLGYKKFDYIPFEIDIDLPKPDDLDIGTYTVKTIDGRRIQISAGLMMTWYFIAASK